LKVFFYKGKDSWYPDEGLGASSELGPDNSEAREAVADRADEGGSGGVAESSEEEVHGDERAEGTPDDVGAPTIDIA
jgi:hypothetical protein